jgi:hypothetical protein
MFDRQMAAFAWPFTLLRAGINIAINRAIMEITTRSSMSVNAVRLCISAFLLHTPWQMLVNHRLSTTLL